MSPNIIMKYVALAGFSAFLIAACSPEAPSRPELRPALDAHLSAIATRDLSAYQSTITDGEELHLIFPEGAALATRQAVLDFHTKWFADPNWVLEPEIVNIIEGADLATTLLKYNYRDTPEGAPRSSWLLLVFKLEDGTWRLVQDQNTRINHKKEAETE